MGAFLRLSAFLVVLALPWAVLAGMPASSERYDFQVLRNGSPIGHHRVVVRSEGQRSEVDVDIELRVRAAGFLTLFRYLHQSREIWEGDRLVSLRSTTDNDGRQEYLNAQAGADGLRVNGSGYSGLLPADTMPTSYWRPDFVRRATIMDSQNGRRLDLAIRPQQYELASAAHNEVPAQRYHLSGDVELTLWYGRDGRWVKTAFTARDGSQIEYLLQ
ncbi:hypothetical protein FNB15_17935 [Ferrovibrio terrae]|uniref:DUF3108 domain-containing protein n=1 Tax=Ferrovibrio terrae TaxID=2594003 RepID=A0A516H5F4_9PROT|nr:DUF6134 family protein [Ferrovibrio terrae]QDO99033.1 hypothetical protein FNB15_17935 [Ferrovibrio terrae]